MYPADQLGVDFTNDDLPDNLTVNGSSLSRAGSAYGNMTNGVIFESGVWALYTDGNRSTSNCLIRGDGNFTNGDNSVEDQFAASYTVNFNGPFPERGLPATQTFVRESLCVWKSTSGYDYGTGTIAYDTLSYGGQVFPLEPLKWAVSAANMLATWMVKTGAQNSPIGTYSGIVPSITVSL